MSGSKNFRGGIVRPITMSLLAALFFGPGSGSAAENVKVYRSTMPDGSVVLGDKPAAGARSVASGTYVLTAPAGAAQAEREYWRRQAEAFDLRQQQREAEAARRKAAAHAYGGAQRDRRDPHEPAPGYISGYSGGYVGAFLGGFQGGAGARPGVPGGVQGGGFQGRHAAPDRRGPLLPVHRTPYRPPAPPVGAL